jgi:hypothetical protein
MEWNEREQGTPKEKACPHTPPFTASAAHTSTPDEVNAAHRFGFAEESGSFHLLEGSQI